MLVASPQHCPHELSILLILAVLLLERCVVSLISFLLSQVFIFTKYKTREHLKKKKLTIEVIPRFIIPIQRNPLDLPILLAPCPSNKLLDPTHVFYA